MKRCASPGLRGMIVLSLIIHGVVVVGCRSKHRDQHEGTQTVTDTPYPIQQGPVFVDATLSAGITFRHINGASGRYYYIETYGSGAAFLDYDNDGDQDLYIVNSATLPGFTSNVSPKNVLYRNNSDGTFTDVTDQAGVGGIGLDGKKLYGMGVCVGDYDNDGDEDIYVTNFGPNVLYRNNGDGTFTDVTKAAGVGDPRLGTSAAFADYDRDGYLDLYVANYAKFSIDQNKECFQGGIRIYCDPTEYEGDSGVLYHNNSGVDRSGGSMAGPTFTDVTERAGLRNESGRQLGVVWGDYDDDGDPDLYIANDKTANFLFMNEGNGTFTESALLANVAYNENGRAEAGMGVDAGDYDNDGDLDLFVTNFQWEPNALYRNRGRGVFTYASFSAGVGAESLPYLGFGTDFFDYDNDGDQDIYVTNGHVNDNIHLFDSAAFYAQKGQLFRNDGAGHFTEVSGISGPGLQIEMVGRGAAFGDYDNDGDIDIFVVNNNQKAILLRNDGGNQNNYLLLKLVGRISNRDAIGTRVRVVSGDLIQMDEVKSGTSYLSQNDLRLHFGLGQRKLVDRVEIRWPSGITQTLTDVQVNRVVRVEEPSRTGSTQ